jgi:hypothetical protein
MAKCCDTVTRCDDNDGCLSPDQFAFTGRAILLAGQDLDPGTAERLRHALEEKLDFGAAVKLGEVCSGLSDPDPLIDAIRSVGDLGVQSGLRRIAQVPWAAVFTSALDDKLSGELASQDSQGRRLRHLCVDDQMPVFFPRRNDVLTVLHLTHLANENTATGLPVYGRHWGRAQRLLIPGIFADATAGGWTSTSALHHGYHGRRSDRPKPRG